MWRTQELYEAVPLALAPVLGNPIALASVGIDRSLPLPQQVRLKGLSSLIRKPQFYSSKPHLSLSNHCRSVCLGGNVLRPRLL